MRWIARSNFIGIWCAACMLFNLAYVVVNILQAAPAMASFNGAMVVVMAILWRFWLFVEVQHLTAIKIAFDRRNHDSTP